MHGRQDGVEVARLPTPTEPGTALATEAPGVLMRGHTPGCVRKGGCLTLREGDTPPLPVHLSQSLPCGLFWPLLTGVLQLVVTFPNSDYKLLNMTEGVIETPSDS